MDKIIIYYQLDLHEPIDKAIENIKVRLQGLERKYDVKGVFLDNFNERDELSELLNSNLSDIDIIYLNKPLSDEFDDQLINELSKTEKYLIKYFNNI